MKTSDNPRPSSFEQQLMHSAHRLRDEQNYQLPLRPLPRRRISWGWISTAAAALIGWVVGISFPLNNHIPESEMAVVTKTDTVVQYQEKVVRDTIIQEVKVPVRIEVPVAPDKEQLQTVSNGCNVECDGIDYALLVKG